MSEVLPQLEHIWEFQINDLRKADKASLNFLVCVGCLNATEFLGGCRTELLGRNNRGDVTTRLRSGLAALEGVFEDHVEDILDLRHSMVHAYIGKVRNHGNVDIANNSDPNAWLVTLGVQIVNGGFVVNVSRWIEDLDQAWSRVVDEIKASPEKARHLKQILDDLPTLR